MAMHDNMPRLAAVRAGAVPRIDGYCTWYNARLDAYGARRQADVTPQESQGGVRKSFSARSPFNLRIACHLNEFLATRATPFEGGMR